MHFLPPEHEVDLYKEGFGEDDLLERASFGKSLSNFVEKVEDPLVIAIDGEWGQGKSFFLKRWVGAHTLQNNGKATMVYFDAFAHDYLDDPLIALVGVVTDRITELSQEAEGASKSDESYWKPIQRTTIKLAKKLPNIGISAVGAGLSVATGGLSDVGKKVADAIIDSASDEGKKLLDEYWKSEDSKRNAMKEFRDMLKTFVEANRVENKQGEEINSLIIVIDELDRCRPDYALSVLEIIKHLFNVKGVQFILGVNLEALGHSVSKRYGEKIDSERYLRRFVNIIFELPTNTNNSTSTAAVVEYADKICRLMKVDKKLGEALCEEIELAASSNKIQVRDVGTIFSRAALVPAYYLDMISSAYSKLIACLLVSSIVNKFVYKRFLNGSITEKELFEYYGASEINLKRIILVEEKGIKKPKRNPRYIRYLELRVKLWKYIFKNGDVKTGSDEDMAKYFYDYSGDVKNIPQKVYEIYLNLVHLAKKNRTSYDSSSPL